MDKILSTRISESIIHRISNLAKQLKTSKKQIIENSILLYASKVENEQDTDIFRQSSGSWDREEPAERIFKKGRNKFNESMRRHMD